MKMTTRFFTVLIGSALSIATVQAQDTAGQDSTGLPGDNFSLQGALEMFKKAGSPEQLEKLLNTESNGVNNLDLNNDGEIDYVKVIDKKDGDAHVFVLQVAISESENQDVAVIELEKTAADKAIVQIIGDEDLYGEETVVEPFEEGSETSSTDMENEVAHGPAIGLAYTDTRAVIVNVWAWPCVRFVFAPAYVVWVSPFRWHHAPVWFRPWRPLYWHAFYPRRVVYYPRYAVVHTHRVTVAHRIYRPARVTSVTVRTRNAVVVNNYRATRTTTRKSVTVGNGNRGVQATRKTTTIEGRNGRKVEHTRTTVRRKRH